eukprot:scaffold77650_cov50-Cyclotella_meneghiniana.AAC.2
MMTYYEVSSEGDLISSRGARAWGGTRPHARYLAPCSNMPRPRCGGGVWRLQLEPVDIVGLPTDEASNRSPR